MPTNRQDTWPHCSLCRVLIDPESLRYRMVRQNRGGSKSHASRVDEPFDVKLQLTLCSKCGRKVIRVIERESAVDEAQEIIANG